MNHIEKVKTAIEGLLSREKDLEDYRKRKEAADRNFLEADSRYKTARDEVARQLRNVCPGKSVMFRGIEYGLNEMGCLVDHEWNGVLLDAETTQPKV